MPVHVIALVVVVVSLKLQHGNDVFLGQTEGARPLPPVVGCGRLPPAAQAGVYYWQTTLSETGHTLYTASVQS